MMTAVARVRTGVGITILPASAPEIRAERELVGRPIDARRFVRSIVAHSLLKTDASLSKASI